jgi:phage gp36-like protein
MAWAWITQEQLSKRLGPQLTKRIYDDDRDGAADTDPIAQLIADASSYVAGYLRPVYPSLTAVNTAVLAGSVNEVVRMTLDAAEWMACKRFPEVARHKDWDALKRANDADLTAVRKGTKRLDVEGSPEPQSTAGGTWGQGDPDYFDENDPPETFNVEGFGDF